MAGLELVDHDNNNIKNKNSNYNNNDNNNKYNNKYNGFSEVIYFAS